MSPKRQTHWAKWPFTYAGQDLAYGEMFSLRGLRNDEKLLVRHVGLVDRAIAPCRCNRDGCGRLFVSPMALDRHGKHAHGGSPMDVFAEERRDDAEEKFLKEVTPEIGQSYGGA